MSARCPDGHESASSDYCDVCGTPMAAPDAPPSWAAAPASGPPDTASAAPPPPAVKDCPHCGARNRAGAFFCESCGYDFTTGALPRGDALGTFDTRVPQAPPAAPVASPAAPEPSPAEPVAAPAPAAPIHAETPAAPGPPPAPAPAAAAARPPVASARRHQAPSRQAVGDWVVEVWVDPAWYAVQDSEVEQPSPNVPEVVRITGRALVGRRSRGGTPEIDCGGDSSVSRRHAEFTTDGTRWWVEDLGSSNGTYVAPASGPLPEAAITPGQRVEIDDDDRVYVGAWTRLVLRRATAGEIAGMG